MYAKQLAVYLKHDQDAANVECLFSLSLFLSSFLVPELVP